MGRVAWSALPVPAGFALPVLTRYHEDCEEPDHQRLGLAVQPGTPLNRDTEADWFVASRWQALDAEYRANYLRIVSVFAFYLVHLLQHYRPFGVFQSEQPSDRVFHIAVTMIVAGWLLMSLAIEFGLRQRFFPDWLPYGTTGVDLAFLTAILCLGGGQQSPLVIAYGLILVLASLRFDLKLIRVAAVAAVFSYLFLLFMGRWSASFGERAIPVVPRYAQCITTVAIMITGVMLGQLIRRVRVISEYFAVRISEENRSAEVALQVDAEKGEGVDER